MRAGWPHASDQKPTANAAAANISLHRSESPHMSAATHPMVKAPATASVRTKAVAHSGEGIIAACTTKNAGGRATPMVEYQPGRL